MLTLLLETIRDWVNEAFSNFQAKLDKKQDVMQFRTMPEASEDLLGEIYQYTGTTTASLVNGYYYKCVSNGASTPVYSWENIPVQAESVKHFEIMPENISILRMQLGAVFETEGFYDKKDGSGGLYLVTNTTQGGLKITDGTTTKYILALNKNGLSSNHIDIRRYGIRPVGAIDFSSITKENTYATQNSEILNNIFLPNQHATLKFPKGRFVFAETLDIHTRKLALKGEPNTFLIQKSYYTAGNDSVLGTMLYFPWLANNEYGIEASSSTVEDIVVIGNPLTYDLTFDRDKMISDPSHVATETISTSEGSQVKCKGIHLAGSKIQNVVVLNFYTGMYGEVSNTFISNVYFKHCHFGLDVKNDNKCVGVYGSEVYILARVYGGLTSIVSARVDSCVNAIQIRHGDTITLMDIDGDWCTDSLIVVGDDNNTSQTVRECVMMGIHGRCNVIKSFNTTQVDGIDVRDLADTNGYGIIWVNQKTSFIKNYISLNHIGGHNPYDETSDYLTPEIALAYNASAIINDNTFVINSGVVTNDEGVRKSFQIKSGMTARIDTSKKSYFIDGNDINSDLRKVTALPTASADCVGDTYILTATQTGYKKGLTYECVETSTDVFEWQPLNDLITRSEMEQYIQETDTIPTASADYVGKSYLYTGTTTSTYQKGGIYECQQTLTDTYEWKLVNVPVAVVKDIVANSADYAAFQSNIALL